GGGGGRGWKGTGKTGGRWPGLAEPGKSWERYDPVLAKALAKKPEDRYQSAEAFRAAVLAAHDAPAAAAVSEETIIVEVLRPAAAVDLSGSPKAPPARAGAARARAAASPSRWPWIAAGTVIALAIAGAAVWRFAPVAPQKSGGEAELARARAEAEDAERRANAAAADAERAKRQLEAERVAEEKTQARAEAKAPKARPAPAASRRIEE